MDTVDTANKVAQRLSFACSDVGPKTCAWQVSGDSEEEIMPRIEQHGREAHNLEVDDAAKEQIRTALRTIPSF